MIAVKLTRCDSYTLLPTQFLKGKVYQVSEEVGNELLSKVDEFGITYFEQVDLNSSSEEAAEPADENTDVEAAPAPAKKSGGKITI
jgi:2-hydroxy-3-keto-5-methylthiopentenyl-1-phosphate phosphatase